MKKHLLLLILMLSVFVSTTVFSFTFYVNPGNKIQDTIDIAIDGDIIIVSDGTYTGDGNRDIDFHGKAITLESENGPDVTIIDCEDSGRGFSFDSGETAATVVDAFTITNGNSDYGGGIFCYDSNPTIINCTITDNSTEWDGGGIYCNGSNPTISNCTINGNEVYHGGGGGISCWNSNPTIANCTINDNSCNWAGSGIHCYKNSSPAITNCTISGNSPANIGGGICCEYFSNPIITNCAINSNSTDYGGALFCDYYSSPTIFNSTISENFAEDDGGGIFCYDRSSPTITNSVINSNMVGRFGGGFSCGYYSDPTITNCIVSGNMADEGGGIFCSENSSPAISNCTINGNSADFGGGIRAYYDCSPTITNCILWHNTALFGHEIALGLYSEYTATLTVRYSDVEGGAAEAYIEPGCTLDMDGTNIDEDPLFVKGPLHDYYLSHVVSGQAADSPCVDAGSDTAENLGLDDLSTRTDGMSDTGIVDMGYHAPYALWIDSIVVTGDDTTIHWNAKPSVSYIMEFSTNLENWTSIPAHETDTWIYTNASGYRNRYYRVREVE